VGTSACMHSVGGGGLGYGGAAATRSREACIIVQAAKLAVKSHLVQGEGSHEVGEVR
jgi:hypothetical protein